MSSAVSCLVIGAAGRKAPVSSPSIKPKRFTAATALSAQAAMVPASLKTVAVPAVLPVCLNALANQTAASWRVTGFAGAKVEAEVPPARPS
ncbi:hypothetical protein D3C80_1199510 [compost metagenome]